MLILAPGQVVNTILVSPVNSSGKIILGDQVPAVWRVLDLTIGEFRLAHAATLESGFNRLLNERISRRWGGELRLREWVDCLVVFRVVLLGLCRLMPNLICPGILGCTERASGLNSNVIDALAYPEEAVFAPVVTPRVTNVPELLAVLLTPAND